MIVQSTAVRSELRRKRRRDDALQCFGGLPWQGAIAAASSAEPAPTPASTFGSDIVFELTPASIEDTGNGNPFQTWSDISGNSRHWAQSTSAIRPLYSAAGGPSGGPAARFETDGTNFRRLAGPNLFALSLSAGEIFCRLKLDDGTPAANRDGLWLIGSAGDPTLYCWSVDGGIHDGFGTTARKSLSSAPGAAAEAWHVYNVTSTASEWTARRDGTQLFTTGTNTVGFSATPLLGASSATRQLVGYVDYVLLIDRAATTDERDFMFEYLGVA